MTKLEFDQTVNTFKDIVDAISYDLENGEYPANLEELDIDEFDRLGVTLQGVRDQMWRPKRFGRGLRDEGVSAWPLHRLGHASQVAAIESTKGGIMAKVKTLPKEQRHLIPETCGSFHRSGSIIGMKRMYYGKDALLVRCGSFIYDVTGYPDIYSNADQYMAQARDNRKD